MFILGVILFGIYPLQGPWLKYKGHLTNISENLCKFKYFLFTYNLMPFFSNHGMSILLSSLCDSKRTAQAVNDEGGEVNVAFDHEHAEGESPEDTIPNVAKRFKARNTPWALIVDSNYGEGSAREHAALQPRFYGNVSSSSGTSVAYLFIGCAMIVARSFARIHETNLKVKHSIFHY